MKSAKRVEKYRRPTRILHWVHTGAFLALVITGIFLYFPPAGFLAQDSISRVIHRVAVIVFVAAPLIYALMNWKASKESVNEALTWGWDDWAWVAAAPRYYFLGDENAMPAQDHLNAGQKLWYFMLLVSTPIFIITGVLMWFFKDMLPAGVFQWSVFVHDLAFIAVFVMLLVHIYLGIIHPLMRQHGGALSSMVDGTITTEYAASHHGKWYQRITKGEGSE